MPSKEIISKPDPPDEDEQMKGDAVSDEAHRADWVIAEESCSHAAVAIPKSETKIPGAHRVSGKTAYPISFKDQTREVTSPDPNQQKAEIQQVASTTTSRRASASNKRSEDQRENGPNFKDQIREASSSRPNQVVSTKHKRVSNNTENGPTFKDQAATDPISTSTTESSIRPERDGSASDYGPDYKDQVRSSSNSVSYRGANVKDRKVDSACPPLSTTTRDEQDMVEEAFLVSAFAVNSVVRPTSGDIAEAIPVNMLRRRLYLGLVVLILILVAVVSTAVVLTRDNSSSSNMNGGIDGIDGANKPVATVGPQSSQSFDTPTISPSTGTPTFSPSLTPTASPSLIPSHFPTSLPTRSPSLFIPLGQKLQGDGDNSQFGTSVALSSNGKVLAVGAIDISNEGHVEVFDLIDESGAPAWREQSRIDGLAIGDKFGWSVALSGDGSVLVVGAPFRDSTFNDVGSLRVFVYQNDSWISVDEEILGLNAGDQMGYSVAVSETGNVLAVGAPYHVTSEDNSGLVRVYRNENNVLTQLGQDILGDVSMYGEAGWSVSLSSDGNILAVGAHRHESPFDETGLARVYALIDDDTWQQVGQDLSGRADRHDLFGQSVSLSGDASTIAAAAGVAYVAVYRLVIPPEQPSTLPTSPPSLSPSRSIISDNCNVSNPDWIGDGFCDDDLSYNSANCAFDGGDCCESTCVIDGVACGDSVDYNCLDPNAPPAQEPSGPYWKQIGDYLAGSAVSLSHDGNIMAVSNQTGGDVFVYRYQQTTDEWRQIGGDITEVVSGGRFGASVALTSQQEGNTTTVAVGAPFEYNGFLADFEGSVRVFVLEEDGE